MNIKKGLFLYCFITAVITGYTQNYFVTTWNTETDDTNSTSITLPVVAGAYDVDTNNDGTFDRLNLTGTQTLDLGSAGIHTIAIRPNIVNNEENELQIRFANGNNPGKLTTIENWGTIIWKSMNQAFQGCSNMNIAPTAGVPNLSKVTDMSSMFEGATNFNSNLSTWNVTNITNMSGMFSNATYFNSNLSAWNVAGVTDMSSMFEGTNFYGNLNTWNVANVINMSGMFSNATYFNSNLSTWNVANVTDMSSMFEGTSFNGNLNTWNVANVINMSSMFQDAESFNGDVSTWNVANVANMSAMFKGAANLNNNLSTWNVANVTDMSSMFENTGFNGNLSVWNVANVTSMSRMFYGTGNFTGDLSIWNVANVTDMSSMFESAVSFNGNLSAWDVSKVTNMDSMFYKASVFNGNVSAWNVANVTNMNSMFSNAPNFNGDVSTWNVAKVTDMNSMFLSASAFNGNLSTWNVSKVADMNFMFAFASDFDSDISTWNVANAADMRLMFLNTPGFSKQNYEKLLSGWSKHTLQDGVVFRAPGVSYCFGKAARKILTGIYHWIIDGDYLDPNCLDLNIAADALLQGPYNSTAALMNDDLRTANRIPLTSPYNDGATVTGIDIFDNADDDDDIVDWVQIELRKSSDITEVLTTASALIQRDGDIVAPDGTSDVTISGTGGDYYISINHRNHIVAATVVALTLSATATVIDFTVVANVTGGINAVAEVSAGKYALFAGDADDNNRIQTEDYNAAATRIGQSGYFRSDTDMNGEVQITDLNLFIARAIGNGIQF